MCKLISRSLVDTQGIPADKVNKDNITKLLEAKGSLIKKALGVSALPVKVGKDSLSFPWLTNIPGSGRTPSTALRRIVWWVR